MLDTPTRTSRTGYRFLQWDAENRVYHPGIDRNWGPYGNSDLGQPVIPHTWGIVEYVSPEGYNGGLGNYLVVYYPHLRRWARWLHLDRILVKVGDKTPPKVTIAHLGTTGTTSAHLHEEILNEKGIAFVKDWKRPYGRYPTGLSKQSVASMWEDPEAFIRNNDHPVPGVDLHKELERAQNALKWASGTRKTMLLRLIERLKRLI